MMRKIYDYCLKYKCENGSDSINDFYIQNSRRKCVIITFIFCNDFFCFILMDILGLY